MRTSENSKSCNKMGLNKRTVYMHGGRVNNSVFATMYTAPIEMAVSQKLLVAGEN